jgi:sulfur-carrier protein adenylyltransferase/sulfurtransferase
MTSAQSLPDLTREEIARYSRHLILPEVGMEGQRKLKAARVLMIGTGGLGAPLGMYLAAAGVGHIGLVDFDVVDASNLQRQIIHSSRDIGRPKVMSAKDRLKGINPTIEIVTYDTMLTRDNALELFKDYDVIVDGTDNYQTRYLVNDACVLLGKPNVYGSIFRFEGQASVFWAAQGACYRCLYPEPPPPGLVPSCAEGGVLGVLPGIVGSIQAAETIKLIVGGADPLINRLLLFDAWKMKFRELKLQKDPHCPICGQNAHIKELQDYDAFCGITHKAHEPTTAIEEITPQELQARLAAGDQTLDLVDIREPHEFGIVRLPGSRSIPGGTIVRRKDELDPHKDIVLICKIGTRSITAIENLRAAGYTGKLFNLRDGLVGWANTVDTSMAKY